MWARVSSASASPGERSLPPFCSDPEMSSMSPWSGTTVVTIATVGFRISFCRISEGTMYFNSSRYLRFPKFYTWYLSNDSSMYRTLIQYQYAVSFTVFLFNEQHGFVCTKRLEPFEFTAEPHDGSRLSSHQCATRGQFMLVYIILNDGMRQKYGECLAHRAKFPEKWARMCRKLEQRLIRYFFSMCCHPFHIFYWKRYFE